MVTQNKCEISIPAILKVEKDILGQVGKYLADMNFHKVVILFGNGLIDLFGDKVLNGMKDNNIEVLLYQEMDTVEINAIMQLGFSSAFHYKRCTGT